MNAPSAPPLEPSRERLRNPRLRYALATRPAFLTITLAGCQQGFAVAPYGGSAFNAATAAATLLLAPAICATLLSAHLHAIMLALILMTGSWK